MRDIFVLFVHIIATVFRLARPGGWRSVIAESALVRHQLLILNRGRKRAPNLRVWVANYCSLRKINRLPSTGILYIYGAVA